MSVSRKRKRRKEGGRGFFAKKGCQKLRKWDSGFGESAARKGGGNTRSDSGSSLEVELRFGAKPRQQIQQGNKSNKATNPTRQKIQQGNKSNKANPTRQQIQQ